MVTFDENLKFKGDISLTAYIDVETTAPTDECLDPESKKMFVVSYVIIFAFHPELDNDSVIIERSFGHSEHEIENPTDWIGGRCCICKFPLKINPTNFNATAEQMSYADFVIFKEHKFLRNIFSERELSSTDSLKNMEQHHKYFEKFLKISVYLQNSINTINKFSECYNDELIDFCNEFCADCSNVAEIKERVLDVLIKNKQGSKIPTFTLQVYAFVYQKLMDFPQT